MEAGGVVVVVQSGLAEPVVAYMKAVSGWGEIICGIGAVAQVTDFIMLRKRRSFEERHGCQI